ncbi:MAG: CDGSH iron-sulfur domain-containing protein [Phycisphaerales bacterium]
MARIVRLEASGPIKVEPQDKPVWICGCGLSQNLPYCDGSHTACKNETEGKVYIYDDSRTEVVEERDA